MKHTFLLLLSLACTTVSIAQPYDLVVSETPLKGHEVMDATGHVVAPGFIDMNTYQHGDDLYRLRAADGVTTVLQLEGGAVDVPATTMHAKAGRSSITASLSITRRFASSYRAIRRSK